VTMLRIDPVESHSHVVRMLLKSSICKAHWNYEQDHSSSQCHRHRGERESERERLTQSVTRTLLPLLLPLLPLLLLVTQSVTRTSLPLLLQQQQQQLLPLLLTTTTTTTTTPHGRALHEHLSNLFDDFHVMFQCIYNAFLHVP